MMNQQIINSILIKATPKEIWEALTNDTMIRLYLEDLTTTCDWHRGSMNDYYLIINKSRLRIWKGEVIEAIEPYYLEQKVLSTLWKIEDKPENYLTTQYIICPVGDYTQLSVIQKNFFAIQDGEQRYQSSVNYWKFILPKIKDTVEKKHNYLTASMLITATVR